MLNSLGYKQVLARGFAVVRTANGTPLRSACTATAEPILDIEFGDGHIDVTPFKGPTPAGAAETARRARAKPKADQGSLF